MDVQDSQSTELAKAENPTSVANFLDQKAENAFAEMAQERATYWMQRVYEAHIEEQRQNELIAEKARSHQDRLAQIEADYAEALSEIAKKEIEDFEAEIGALSTTETKKTMLRFIAGEIEELQVFIDGVPLEHRWVMYLVSEFLKINHNLYEMCSQVEVKGSLTDEDAKKLIIFACLNPGDLLARIEVLMAETREEKEVVLMSDYERKRRLSAMAKARNGTLDVNIESARYDCKLPVSRFLKDGDGNINSLIVRNEKPRALTETLIQAGVNSGCDEKQVTTKQAEDVLCNSLSSYSVRSAVTQMFLGSGRRARKAKKIETAKEVVDYLIKIEMRKAVELQRDAAIERLQKEGASQEESETGLASTMTSIQLHGFSQAIPNQENGKFELVREKMKRVHARRLREGEATIPGLFGHSTEEELQKMAVQVEEMKRREGLGWFQRLIDAPKVVLPVPAKQQEVKDFFSGFDEDAERLYDAYLYAHYLYQVGMELYKNRPDETVMWKGVERVCLALGTVEALLTQCRYYETRLSVERIVPDSLMPDLMNAFGALREIANNPFSAQLDRALGDFRDRVRAQIEVQELEG